MNNHTIDHHPIILYVTEVQAGQAALSKNDEWTLDNTKIDDQNNIPSIHQKLPYMNISRSSFDILVSLKCWEKLKQYTFRAHIIKNFNHIYFFY